MELTGLRKDIILTDKQYQVLLNDNSIWCDVSTPWLLGRCSLKHINPSNAEATFVESKDAKIFENYLNHVMLVFIGSLLLSTVR